MQILSFVPHDIRLPRMRPVDRNPFRAFEALPVVRVEELEDDDTSARRPSCKGYVSTQSTLRHICI